MARNGPKKNKFVKAWMAEHVNDPWVKEATRLVIVRCTSSILPMQGIFQRFLEGLGAAFSPNRAKKVIADGGARGRNLKFIQRTIFAGQRATDFFS